MSGVDLTQRWPLPGAAAVRDALLEAYGEDRRGYHDLRHLAEVLDRLDELEANRESFERVPVRLAAWFHDAVYDARPEAEERSARWAAESLAGVVDVAVAEEVQRLVRLTADHHTQGGDRNGAALCDADLAILSAPRDRYAAYVSDLRREYGHLRDADFSAGRAAVLQDLRSRRRLFATTYGHDHWEPLARANLAWELAELT